MTKLLRRGTALIGIRPRFDTRPVFWIAIATGLLAGFVFFDTAYQIVRYYTPLFYGDAWETVADYQRFVLGHYAWRDLFAQHNEHRLAVPRLIFLADFVLGQGRNIINETATFLVQSLHALLIVRIAATIERGAVLALSVAFVVILMFGFGQSDNFMWGFQVQFVSVYAAATLAFWNFACAFDTQGRERAALIVSSYAMVLVSTFCMSNGFLSAFVLIGIAIVRRAPFAIHALTFTMAVAITAAYFHGFQLQPSHSPPGYALQHPAAFLSYVLTYLGGPVGQFGPGAAAGLGAIGVALTCVAAFRETIHRGVAGYVALLAVMVLVLGTAAATSFGRAFFGIEQALESRYLTPASIFWATQFVYWISLIPNAPRIARWPAFAGFACVASVILTGTIVAHEAARSLMPWTFHHAEMQTNALLSDLQSTDLLADNYPDQDKLQRLAGFLRKRHLNVFALPEAHTVGRKLGEADPRRDDQACTGAFDSVGPAGRDGIAVAGWAWDNTRSLPVDRIVLTDADDRVVGVASGGWYRYRPDAARDPQVRGYDQGWRGFAKVSDKTAVTAYAYIEQGRVACKLRSEQPPARLDGRAGLPVETTASRLGQPIDADIIVAGDWKTNGYPPTALPPRDVDKVAGAWSGAGAAGGKVSIGPFVSPTPSFVLPVVTGPDATGLSILIKDAETDQIYARLRPRVATTWTALLFDVPRAMSGRRLLIVAQSDGSDRWMAVGRPHQTLH